MRIYSDSSLRGFEKAKAIQKSILPSLRDLQRESKQSKIPTAHYITAYKNNSHTAHILARYSSNLCES